MNKKSLLIALTVLFSLCSKAQNFESNFLGADFQLYKGVLFKMDSEAISGFDHRFYLDLKFCKSEFDNNVAYPDTKYKFMTVKDSLTNRVFIVENIINKNGETFKSESYFDNPIFILKDTATEEIIYYKYDKEYEHNFPFLTSEINYETENLCDRIERRIDDFTGDVTLNSPISENNSISSMIIYKGIVENSATYNLYLRTYGSTVNVDGTGAIILFNDGTKLSKKVNIEVEADSKGFEYSVYIKLAQEDLNILSTKKVKKFRLYVYDEEVNPSEADRFRIYVNCILNKK